jgi:peptidoglycan/LPS O-acetylase OafA/YrhL
MHKHNFGFLRLFFATLVIVSHSPEIIDGNRSRELLTNLFGTLSSGELAVDAFFLISGFLIAKSYQQSTTNASYLMKRIRRIYPGFIVAFLFCVLAVGPFVGAEIIGWKQLLGTIFEALTLRPPSVPGFITMHVQALNGAMWSIAVEFRCYLFVLLFGSIGLLRRRWPLIVLTACLLLAMAGRHVFWIPRPAVWLLGDPSVLIRMLSIFCVGILFYLYRNEISYKRTMAAAAIVALLVCLFQPMVAEAAFAIFGGYLIFWIALHFKSAAMQSINGNDDISYGVYLYAWPVQSSLVYFFGIQWPWVLTAISIPIVYGLGFLSWHMVEKRFVRRKPIKDFSSGKDVPVYPRGPRG